VTTKLIVREKGALDTLMASASLQANLEAAMKEYIFYRPSPRMGSPTRLYPKIRDFKGCLPGPCYGEGRVSGPNLLDSSILTRSNAGAFLSFFHCKTRPIVVTRRLSKFFQSGSETEICARRLAGARKCFEENVLRVGRRKQCVVRYISCTCQPPSQLFSSRRTCNK
jgi:hypothetical protein